MTTTGGLSARQRFLLGLVVEYEAELDVDRRGARQRLGQRYGRAPQTVGTWVAEATREGLWLTTGSGRRGHLSPLARELAARNGVDVLPSTGETKINPTRFETPLGRLAKRYVKGRLERGELARSSSRSIKTVLGALVETFGARPVEQLGPSDIDRWLATTRHLAAATRRSQLSAVRGFMLWLQRERHIRNDPLRFTKPLRVPRTVPRALTRDETDALWAVLPDDRARAIVALMLGVGLRRCEVLGLQVGDWDRRERTLRVVGKGGHQRLLPVPDHVRVHLDRYLVGALRGPMIQRVDGPGGISNSYLGILMKQWMYDAGIKSSPHDGRACHSLRHTLASEVVDVEPDLRVVQQILGHQSLTSTQIYLRHIQMPKMRAAMEAAAGNDPERATA